MWEFTPAVKLGVGFPYQPGLRAAIEVCRDLIDFFELSPDLLCDERITEGGRTLVYRPALLDDALSCCAEHSLVVHGLGLSIGSVSGWEEGYLRILDELHTRREFIWHSEHLGFMTTRDATGQPMHTGVPLPLPFTEEALDLIVPRAESLCRRYGVPFLIENLTYYLPHLPADGGRDEIDFLNDIVERSGCGLLLDLYNLYCNSVNFRFDAKEALARLRLDRVVQIHVAGGTTHDGFMLDVHSDLVPEPVWDLLDWVLPRAPNLSGVVYELLEQALRIVGVEGIRRELERAHAVWNKHRADVPALNSYVAG